MAADPFGQALDDFRQWITTARTVHGDPAVVAGEVTHLVGLMRDHLGIEHPSDLMADDLHELLLHDYPRKAGAAAEELAAVIAAMRDLVAYLFDARDLTRTDVRALTDELDEIEPLFVSGHRCESAAPGLKELFGLPDQFLPIRLPAEAELAASARGAGLVQVLLALARWVADREESLGDPDELDDEQVAEAAAAIGLARHTRFSFLWDIAADLEFIDRDDDDGFAVPGETARSWAELDDPRVLQIWMGLFTMLSGSLVDIELPGDEDELNFSGHAIALAITLFLDHASGIPAVEISDSVRHFATGQFDPATGQQAWQSYIKVHGDPAGLLIQELTDLGAVQVRGGEDGDVLCLTPLGRWAVRQLFEESAVEVPLLPTAQEMTAAELIDMAGAASGEEFQTEVDAWLGHRTPESAARDLLAVAAGQDAVARILAVGVVVSLGEPASAAWASVADRIELSGYAKAALAPRPGADAPELDALEAAWMTVDALVMAGLDPDSPDVRAAVQAALAEVTPPGREEPAFEAMARIEHPDATPILTLIGQCHPDKKVAKAARKAAYKATTRAAARVRQ